MAQVIAIEGEVLIVRTSTGRELPVLRGVLPELDLQAEALEKRIAVDSTADVAAADATARLERVGAIPRQQPPAQPSGAVVFGIRPLGPVRSR